MTSYEMHATARACANIALAKYWGKRPGPYNIPAVGSLSITLAALQTQTSVIYDPSLTHEDVITFDNAPQPMSDHVSNHRAEGQTHHGGDPHAFTRIRRFMDTVRSITGITHYARIHTHNNFPTASGLASSASGFAALALAATQAAGAALSLDALSALARRGSGSAARSIYGGFVEMICGTRDDGTDAIAHPLLEASAWPLHVCIAITSEARKATGSTEGMQRTAMSSPFYDGWLSSWRTDVEHIRRAIMQRDFGHLAAWSEHSCLKMHGLMLSAQPGLVYWNGTTVDIMHAVRAMRQNNIAAFFTIDAGPQVKVVCLPHDASTIRQSLAEIPGVVRVIESDLGSGVQLCD